jgi:hypothetical protein
MLVEGGYLHSMKQIIEKAAGTPEPPRPDRGDDDDDPPKASVVGRSLRKLSSIIRRKPAA